MKSKQKLKAFMLAFLTAVFTLHAQDDAAELAKKLANPISSLISVPFQNNSDYGIGYLKGSRNTLNFQPVLPLSLNENLNVITRLVLPIVTQNNITGAGEKQSGLSDAVASAFFSPKNSKNGFTWGAGPAVLIPTGTDDFLSSKKFGAGPTAVALKQIKGWSLGILANQLWSIAGSDDRPDVSQMFVQPFITYNWKSGSGLGVVGEYTQNWKSNTTSIWIIPTVSGVTSIGTQKVSLAIGPRLNIIAPESMRADWGWRAVVIFIFPK